jgi:hypothetical protein
MVGAGNNTTTLTPPPTEGLLLSLCPAYAPPSSPEWSFHAYYTLMFVLLFGVTDALSKSYLIPDNNTRWFSLHALANALTCIFSIPDLVYVFRNPLCGMVTPAMSWLPTHAGMAIHIYHCIGFSLRTDDIVHHVVFGGGMGCLNWALPWGRVTNSLLFFITGLPGGITYVMLVLVKLGKLKSLTEKSASAWINTWIRTPGLTWFSSVILVNLMYSNMHVPVWAALMCICLAFLNGTYYGAQALENFVTRRTEVRERSAKLNSKGLVANDGSAVEGATQVL